MGKRILFVEEDAGFRRVFTHAIREALVDEGLGVTFVEAGSLSEARSRLREGGLEEIIERPGPAVVEPGLRERAETQLVKNKSRAGELRKNGRKYLLSGFIRCGICGYACHGSTSTSRVSGGTKKYSYYGCVSNRADPSVGAPPHRAPSIAADWIEDLVWTDVRAFLENPGEVLERLRFEGIDTDASLDELETRRDDLLISSQTSKPQTLAA